MVYNSLYFIKVNKEKIFRDFCFKRIQVSVANHPNKNLPVQTL